MSFINRYRNYFIKYNLYFIKIKISLETIKFLSKNGHFFRKIRNFSQNNNILILFYKNKVGNFF
jgi:hypothetical protein